MNYLNQIYLVQEIRKKVMEINGNSQLSMEEKAKNFIIIDVKQ